MRYKIWVSGIVTMSLILSGLGFYFTKLYRKSRIDYSANITEVDIAWG